MNLAELSTVVRYGLPVVQIVFRNGSLGLVRQMQKRSMEGRYSAVDMDRGTDFVRLAEAFGVKAARIDAAEQVEGVIQQALRAGQPCLIDCAIDIEELALPLEEP